MNRMNESTTQNNLRPNNQSHAPFAHVQSVLVVLSSRALAFDQSGLRKLITYTYPGAAVFFVSTSGDPVGVEGPHKVDLILDFSEPGARQGFFFASKMRSRAKHAVGRHTGWFFRKKKYDRVYDEKNDAARPVDYLESERWTQKKVLELAGVRVVQQGGLTPDRSKEIASELPPLNL
jgi:hypothetical protein